MYLWVARLIFAGAALAAFYGAVVRDGFLVLCALTIASLWWHDTFEENSK